MKIVGSLIFLLFLLQLAPAQDIRIGAPQDNRWNPQGGFYEYSDPRYVNISVNIWGYVRFPGKYFVPEQTRLIDLLSYAGGPLPDAFLDDIRLLSNASENKDIQKFDIEYLMEKSDKEIDLTALPKLNAGDVILVPGQPKLYFREYTTLVLSITSTLISLAILILNIVK